MLSHLYSVGRQSFRDWNHGLTALIGLGWIAQSVEAAGQLLGLAAIVIGITCSVRREIRESRASRR